MISIPSFDQIREIAASKNEYRTDHLGFRVSIPASGAVSYASPDYNQRVDLHADYDYLFYEMRIGLTTAGLTQNAATADAYFNDIDEIRFNVKVTGTGEDMFTDDVELSGLISPVNGQARPVPMAFAVGAGKQLDITATRRASTISVARVLAVHLWAALAPKGYHLQQKRA